jgi:hypothetical protein
MAERQKRLDNSEKEQKMVNSNKRKTANRLLLAVLFLAVMTAAAGAAEWAPYVYYTTGTAVTYQGASYTCRQSHTSLPGWEPPNVLALWLPGGNVSTATPTLPPNNTPTNTPINTPTITVTGSATPTPTSGLPLIPGKIEAETYTSMYGVQTEATSDTGGGTNVGWIDAGDWMEYSVYAATAGTYTVQYRVAALSTAGSINLLVDGSSKGTTTIPVTSGWQTWTTVTGPSFTAGSAWQQAVSTSTGSSSRPGPFPPTPRRRPPWPHPLPPPYQARRTWRS